MELPHKSVQLLAVIAFGVGISHRLAQAAPKKKQERQRHIDSLQSLPEIRDCSTPYRGRLDNASWASAHSNVATVHLEPGSSLRNLHELLQPVVDNWPTDPDGVGNVFCYLNVCEHEEGRSLLQIRPSELVILADRLPLVSIYISLGDCSTKLSKEGYSTRWDLAGLVKD